MGPAPYTHSWHDKGSCPFYMHRNPIVDDPIVDDSILDDPIRATGAYACVQVYVYTVMHVLVCVFCVHACLCVTMYAIVCVVITYSWLHQNEMK